MVKVKINGEECEITEGMTILQACEEAGLEIPRFCYHDRLSIAGNCRMCLVDVEGAPKPTDTEIFARTACLRRNQEHALPKRHDSQVA